MPSLTFSPARKPYQPRHPSHCTAYVPRHRLSHRCCRLPHPSSLAATSDDLHPWFYAYARSVCELTSRGLCPARPPPVSYRCSPLFTFGLACAALHLLRHPLTLHHREQAQSFTSLYSNARTFLPWVRSLLRPRAPLLSLLSSALLACLVGAYSQSHHRIINPSHSSGLLLCLFRALVGGLCVAHSTPTHWYKADIPSSLVFSRYFTAHGCCTHFAGIALSRTTPLLHLALPSSAYHPSQLRNFAKKAIGDYTTYCFRLVHVVRGPTFPLITPPSEPGAFFCHQPNLDVPRFCSRTILTLQSYLTSVPS